MLLRASITFAALLAFVPAAHADQRSEAKAQVEFGIKVAQNGLWKEATYRWEKATQIDPTYPEAWNNLAIGYEYRRQIRRCRRRLSARAEARSEERADPRQLRSLQRNQ